MSVKSMFQSTINKKIEKTNINKSITNMKNKMEQNVKKIVEQNTKTPPSKNIERFLENRRKKYDEIERLDLSNYVLQKTRVRYKEIDDAGFTTQGYTIINNSNDDNKLIISAYSKNGDRSRLYLYDENTKKLESIIILDNKNHVGGITYDENNGIIYVAANNGKVDTYNYNKILEELNNNSKSGVSILDMNDSSHKNNLEAKGIKIQNNVDVISVLNKPYCESRVANMIGNVTSYKDGMDTIYFKGNKLYSATYGGFGELVCSEIKYEKDNNGNIKRIIESKESYKIDKLNGSVQGICFYEENGTTMMISSSSAYGASTSRLTKWKVTENGLKPIGYKYIDHPGLEGIDVKDGVITGVFEYNKKEVQIVGQVNDFKNMTISEIDRFFNLSGYYWDKTHGFHFPSK